MSPEQEYSEVLEVTVYFTHILTFSNSLDKVLSHRTFSLLYPCTEAISPLINILSPGFFVGPVALHF